MLRPLWNNVEITLCQRCFNVGQRRCINVVQRWKSDVGFCCIFNVRSTLFQRWNNVDSTFKCWLGCCSIFSFHTRYVLLSWGPWYCKLCGRFYTILCGCNNLEQSWAILFEWLNNNYMKVNNGKSHLLHSDHSSAAATVDKQ